MIIDSNVVSESELLKPARVKTIPARTEPFDVYGFYQWPQEGINAWGPVLRGVIDGYECNPIPPTPERQYVASLVKADTCYANVRTVLPEECFSTLEDLAALIADQWRGLRGFLHNRNTCFIDSGSRTFGILAVHISVWPKHTWDVSYGFAQSSSVSDIRAGEYIICPGTASL